MKIYRDGNRRHANDTLSSRLVLFPAGSTSDTNYTSSKTTTHIGNETNATTMGLSAITIGKTTTHPDRTNGGKILESMPTV